MATQTKRQDNFSGTGVRSGPGSRTPILNYPGVNGRRLDGTAVDATAEGTAKFLGWFSLGLGLAQLLAPHQMVKLVGLESTMRRKFIMQAVGIREIIAGLGALTQFRPLTWTRARVAGDAMDLVMLGRAFQAPDAERKLTILSIAAVAGITITDILTTERLQLFNPTRYVAQDDRSIHVKKSITINRPAEDVYSYWHDFQNLPRFMGHLESVQMKADGRSHWKAKAPVGRTVEWDAEVVLDRPNEMIAWQSVDGSTISNSGSVYFTSAPGERGTEVRVELQYKAPGGALGAGIAKLLGEEPSVQIGDDLRTLKQVLETGDIARSDTAVQGRRDGAQPARPRRSA